MFPNDVWDISQAFKKCPELKKKYKSTIFSLGMNTVIIIWDEAKPVSIILKNVQTE